MYKLIFLGLGMLALGLDAYVVAGIIPQISKTFQISQGQAGQAVTVFTFFYAISAPLFTTLLAGKSIKKILFSSLCFFLVANIVSSLAPNFMYFFVSRLFAGIGAGLFSPMAMSAAVSLVGENQKGRALGFTLGGMSCGTVLGVPLGLWLSELYSWHYVFWLVVVVSAIALLGLARYLPMITLVPPPSLRARFAVLVDKKVALTVLITFLTAVASLGTYTYITSIMAVGDAMTNIMPALWVWGLGGVLGSFGVGILLDKIQKNSLILFFILLLLLLSLMSLGFASLLGQLVFIPFFLWGMMGWSSLAPQQQVLVEAQPNHASAVLGLNSSANYMGSACGAFAGGLLLASGFQPNLLPFMAAAVLFFALVGLCKRKLSDN
ncbi:MFS transporter [Bartonella sp. AA89HNZF]|uniref:MFS transporter n=1 Tax=Bartonella sp. AA89HNZF TaxID=3243442 RepID=UPI0035D0EA58